MLKRQEGKRLYTQHKGDDMIAIIDYGAGNLQSVKNALDYLKVESKITSNAQDIVKAKKIIFPGVGNFGDVMWTLNSKDLVEPILKVIDEGKPFLGICLGMQVLFEKSEESEGVAGLGIFEGAVKKLDVGMKIPQIGWNSINAEKKSDMLENIKNGSYLYFNHSYYVEPEDKRIILMKTVYGSREFPTYL